MLKCKVNIFPVVMLLGLQIVLALVRGFMAAMYCVRGKYERIIGHHWKNLIIEALCKQIHWSTIMCLFFLYEIFILKRLFLLQFSFSFLYATIIYRQDFCCSKKNTHSGYSREEILGCNCRFLNGPGTSVEVLEEVRSRIL